MRSLFFAVAVTASLFSGAAPAQVAVPHTFSAGSPARAAEVNANFQALVAAVNGIGARVAKLEGTIVAADLVGTYVLHQFQSEIGGGGSPWVSGYTGGGTVTLQANGSATTSGNVERGVQLNLPSGTLGRVNRPQPAETMTWSYTGGKVMLFGTGLSVADGGRLLIGTSSTANAADGTSVILLLTRVN